MSWSSRRGPEHLLDYARFEAPDGFAIEFAVDDVSVFSSSGLSAPAASGQVSIAIDNDGSPQMSVEFREFKNLVPLEGLLRS